MPQAVAHHTDPARNPGDDRDADLDATGEGASHRDSSALRVVLEGNDLKEAAAVARALEHDEGLVFVSPYDDAAIIAGAGTVAVELLDYVPQVDMLVIPVGGGGLISGMAVAARARRPDVEIVGVEADRYPSMANAVRGRACTRRRHHGG